MKCSVKITKELLNELNKPTKILSIILICMGFLLSITCFIDKDFYVNYHLFYISIFMAIIQIFVGILLIFQIKNNTSKQLANNQTNDMEFFENHFTVNTTKNGEIVTTAKINYSDLSNVRETQNYLFLYQSRINVLVADKKQLGEENVKKIKLYIAKENKRIKLKND